MWCEVPFVQFWHCCLYEFGFSHLVCTIWRFYTISTWNYDFLTYPRLLKCTSISDVDYFDLQAVTSAQYKDWKSSGWLVNELIFLETKQTRQYFVRSSQKNSTPFILFYNNLFICIQEWFKHFFHCGRSWFSLETHCFADLFERFATTFFTASNFPRFL